MRSFIAALLVAAMLAGGAIGYGIYIERTADTLHGYTDRISGEIDAQNFVAAREITMELAEEITDRKEILGAICDHKDIYDMQRLLAELICFLEEEELPDSRAHCAAVSMMIEKLSGNTAPALFNVL